MPFCFRPFITTKSTFQDSHNSTSSFVSTAIGVNYTQGNRIFLQLWNMPDILQSSHNTVIHLNFDCTYPNNMYPNNLTGCIIFNKHFTTINRLIIGKLVPIRTCMIGTPRIKNLLIHWATNSNWKNFCTIRIILYNIDYDTDNISIIIFLLPNLFWSAIPCDIRSTLIF